MDDLIARTVEVLQPLIKKPKLTPKLLGKPPFRFLHDVVSELTRSTGFAEGLYGPDELNAGAIKDKDSKLAYLDKIHKYVCAAKGFEVPLKLGKVVAGMEAEKTNEFLQAMAEAAADGSVNRDACLGSVLGTDTGGGDAEAAQAAAAQAAAAEAEAAAARAAAEARSSAAAEAEDRAEAEQRKREEDMAMQAQQDEAARQHEEEMQRRAEEEAASAMPPPDMGAPPPAPAAPPPAQPQFSEPEPGMDDGMPPPPQMAQRPLPARPTTARRPPPKLPSKEVKLERREREQKNLPPGMPQPAAQVVGLISEGVEDDDDEEEVQEAAPTLPGWDLGEKDGDEVVEGEQHGALVADIMKEKQKMQQGGDDSGPAAEEPQQEGIIIIKKDKRRGSLTSSQGKRAPKQTENDIHKLRASIQQLCQSTTPLGKCIEGVQGDLEHMEREFRQWKAEGQANTRKLEHTTNNTDQALAPLQGEVVEQEQKIKDMQLQINRVKANIMQNNLTIHSLLKGVVAGHRN